MLFTDKVVERITAFSLANELELQEELSTLPRRVCWYDKVVKRSETLSLDQQLQVCAVFSV